MFLIIQLAMDIIVKFELSQNLFDLLLYLLIKDVLSLIVDRTCLNWCFRISWIWYIWLKDVCKDLHSTSTRVLVKLNFRHLYVASLFIIYAVEYLIYAKQNMIQIQMYKYCCYQQYINVWVFIVSKNYQN